MNDSAFLPSDVLKTKPISQMPVVNSISCTKIGQIHRNEKQNS